MNNKIFIIVFFFFMRPMHALESKNSIPDDLYTRAAEDVRPYAWVEVRDDEPFPLGELEPRDISALEWESFRHGSEKKYRNFWEAEAYCADKGAGWRVPTVWELAFFRDSASLLIPHSERIGLYWASSSVPDRSSDSVWRVSMERYGVSYLPIVRSVPTEHYFVRCVRPFHLLQLTMDDKSKEHYKKLLEQYEEEMKRQGNGKLR